jgi:carotenoid 1,2-hydratase
VHGPRFDVAVPLNGYHWWYADGLSDDGLNGFTVIAFIGSVFSPYYKWARRKGAANPENHCAINVALYGDKKRWAMTERSKAALTRSQHQFCVGPSSLRWDGDTLEISIHEVGMPVPHKIAGTIRIAIPKPCAHVEVLEASGAHCWNPIAPKARVSVAMTSPALSWQGTAYVDNNWGAAPLEDSFKSWIWARTPTAEGAEIVYDMTFKDGTQSAFALQSDANHAISRVPLPPLAQLAKTRWQIARPVRAYASPTLITTFEDTPFYARTLLQQPHQADPTLYESLDLQRFANPLVQMLLPFRMPRRK